MKKCYRHVQRLLNSGGNQHCKFCIVSSIESREELTNYFLTELCLIAYPDFPDCKNIKKKPRRHNIVGNIPELRQMLNDTYIIKCPLLGHRR